MQGVITFAVSLTSLGFILGKKSIEDAYSFEDFIDMAVVEQHAIVPCMSHARNDGFFVGFENAYARNLIAKSLHALSLWIIHVDSFSAEMQN